MRGPRLGFGLLLPALLSILVGPACKEHDPRFCEKNSDCQPGAVCDVVARECQPAVTGTGGSGAGGSAGTGGGASGGAQAGRDANDDQAPEAPPVGCTNDQDCARTDPDHPICENHVCAGCAGPGQCPAAQPICGGSRRCAACASNDQCGGIADPARTLCEVASGMCVQCLTNAGCSADKPICGAGRTCAGCASTTECGALGDSTRAVCDTGSGRCVQCMTNASCQSANKPICGAGRTCGACASNAECQQKDAALPFCDSGSGKCVQCLTNSTCPTDKPICGGGACAGCTGNGDCQGLNDPARTVCDISSGKCVQCVTSMDCTAPLAPICDVPTHACRKCALDAECAAKAADPGVCMSHQDGRCATDGEAIYVKMGAACSDSAGNAGGTAAMPYCSMQPAVAVVGPTRDLIVVRGSVNSASGAFSASSKQMTLIGQQNGAIGGASPGFHLAIGDAFVRDLKFGPSLSIGCQADSGSTLRLQHVSVNGNTGGGLLLTGAAFDIKNSSITNNGPGDDGMGNVLGGIRVSNPPAAASANLALVTIQNNMGAGVSCSAKVQATGVLVIDNTPTQITAPCAFSSCGVTSSTCGAQP